MRFSTIISLVVLALAADHSSALGWKDTTNNNLRHTDSRELQDLDGSLSVTNQASASFDLAAFDINDKEGTTEIFQLDTTISKGNTITCTLACTTNGASGNTRFALLENFVAGSGSTGGDILEFTDSTSCPTTVAYTATADLTAYVTTSSEGGITSATVSCLSESPPPTPAPTSSPSGSSSSICFSEKTTVQVQNKGTIYMKDLQVQDKVLVASNTNNKPIYQTVYAWGHKDVQPPTEYLQIHTTPADSKEPLEISAAHLIYVNGKKHPVRADSIQIGDTLISTFNHKVTVTKINTVWREGAYMPLTKDGTIVVNNILASTSVSIWEDAPQVIQHCTSMVSEDQLLQWWLAPYRMVCLYGTPSLCANEALTLNKDEEGIAHWLVLGRSLARTAETWGFWAQIGGILAMSGLLALFLIMEALVAFGCSVPGVVLLTLMAVVSAKKFGEKKGLGKQLKTE